MTTHIDAVIDKESSSSSDVRTAKVTRTESHGAVGVPVFFTAEELEQQGIDPDDLDRIAVRIEDGFVLFRSPESDSEQETSE